MPLEKEICLWRICQVVLLPLLLSPPKVKAIDLFLPPQGTQKLNRFRQQGLCLFLMLKHGMLPFSCVCSVAFLLSLDILLGLPLLLSPPKVKAIDLFLPTRFTEKLFKQQGFFCLE